MYLQISDHITFGCPIKANWLPVNTRCKSMMDKCCSADMFSNISAKRVLFLIKLIILYKRDKLIS